MRALEPEPAFRIGRWVLPSLLPPVLRLSLLVGVLLHLVAFFVFRTTEEPFSGKGPSVSFVQLVSLSQQMPGDSLEEQVVLFDSSPLFIPGRWNAAHNLPMPDWVSGPGGFGLYSPEIDVLEALRPNRKFMGEVHRVAVPDDLLGLRFLRLFGMYGQSFSAEKTAGAAHPVAEIQDFNGTVLRTIKADLEDFTGFVDEPALYSLRVEAGGRVLGAPERLVSSQNVSFDRATLNWLLEPRNTALLPVGYFLIRLYP